MKKLYLSYFERDLSFKRPAWTSRGVMKSRKVYIIVLTEKVAYAEEIWRGIWDGEVFGAIGEVSPLPGLNLLEKNGGGKDEIHERLQKLRDRGAMEVTEIKELCNGYPALEFGVELALEEWTQRWTGKEKYSGARAQNIAQENSQHHQEDTKQKGKLSHMKKIYVNGLIWVEEGFGMHEQVDALMEQGFQCLKLKMGVDFQREERLLKYIRERWPKVELRVDFNGSLKSYDQAMQAMKVLEQYRVSSAEQPLAVTQGDADCRALRRLEEETSVQIAMDEELIGIRGISAKREWMDAVRPGALVLKPTLLGGFQSCEEWIALAKEYGSAWWVTSALESKIGLYGIARWLYPILKTEGLAFFRQGLGTGDLYQNNFVHKHNSGFRLVGEHLEWSSSDP